MKHTLQALFALVTITLACCISTFDPPNRDHKSLLVVEGFITDGEFSLRLSNSLAISSTDYPATQIVSGAQVWVECEDGGRFDAVEIRSGTYNISAGTLEGNLRYRLRISLNGEEYESDWRIPQPTPSFNMNIVGSKLILNVNGEPTDPRHYYWSYNETWEISAPINATHYFGYYEGDYGPYNAGYSLGTWMTDSLPKIWAHPNGRSPFYYCWKHDSSNGLLLGSTELLTENTLRGYELYDLASERLSIMYHTKVTQYALGNDAYFYYNNQKKNSDETGSIFGPIPSEMKGNITCTTSPDTPVIGFIEVSKLVQRELFHSEQHTPSTAYSCPTFTNEEVLEEIKNMIDDNEIRRFTNSLYMTSAPPTFIDTVFTNLQCIDCRQQGGSKSRPEGWPNDHF